MSCHITITIIVFFQVCAHFEISMHFCVMIIFYHERVHHCGMDTPTEGFYCMDQNYIYICMHGFLIEFLLKHGIDITDFC